MIYSHFCFRFFAVIFGVILLATDSLSVGTEVFRSKYSTLELFGLRVVKTTTPLVFFVVRKFVEVLEFTRVSLVSAGVASFWGPSVSIISTVSRIPIISWSSIVS